MDGGDNFFFLRILEEADDDGRDLEGSTPTDLKERKADRVRFLKGGGIITLLSQIL